MENYRSNVLILILVSVLFVAWSADALAEAGSLVGYWPLDEGMGNVAEDLSGQGNAGTVLGAGAWEQTQRGSGLLFNGKDTTVRIPDSPVWNIGKGELTICLWVKIDDPKPGAILEHAFGRSPGPWMLKVGPPPNFPPILVFYDNKKQAGEIRFTGFEPGKWQHLALAWKRAEDGWMKSYVNGRLAVSQPTPNVTRRQLGDMFVGSMRAGYEFFNGQIKEVAIFNRTLLDEQIQEVYEKGIQLPSPVVISSLRADRILYDPNQPGTASVRVRNTSDSMHTVELVTDLVFGLDDARTIQRVTLELPPRSSVVKQIDFAFEAEEYGCELRAAVVEDGRTLSIRSEFFAVSDNLWKVALGGADLVSQSARFSKAKVDAVMAKARQTYTNWFEKFFWAPDDWADMVPGPNETWLSSQGGRYENTAMLQYAIETAHRHGIKAITYGKAMSYGHRAWEIVRRHPDWFGLDPYGRPMAMPADQWVDLLDQWRHYDVLADLKSGKSHGEYWVPRGYPDHRLIEVIDHGIDQVIGSARLFSWDGVRFDSSGFRAYYIDGTKDGRDGVNIRSMKRLKKRLWDEVPGFLIGHNTRIPPYLSKDGRAYPLNPSDPTGHEFRETLAGGCLWMGEGFREKAPRNGTVRYTTWSQFARDEVRCIRTIKHYGGHFCYSYGLGQRGEVEDLYRFTIGTMIGAHQYGLDHLRAGGSEDWGRFLTRWSGFIWGHRLRALADAGKRVSVESPRPLWWEPFVNERIVSPVRRYVIVNLLNPPVIDQIEKTGDQLPPPVETATVALHIPPDETLKKVYFLSPGSPNRAEPLAARQNGNVALMKLEPFDIWAMVVCELEGRYQVPETPPRFTEPMSADEIAELKDWQRKRITINVADNMLNPTPQHDPSQVKLKQHPESTVELSEPLSVGGDPGLDVLIFKGLHHYAYRIPEALDRAAPASGLRITETTGREADRPNDHRGFFQYDLIILADYGDGLRADTHHLLADYVTAGGRLVVLGGIGCLGQGFYKGSALETVLPVEVRVARDIYRLPQPLPLGPRAKEVFPGLPLLYYYHAVRPHPDATPLLFAGSLPVAYGRQVGKGRSVVFAGTTLGEARNDTETPFWQSQRWPQVLGELLVNQ